MARRKPNLVLLRRQAISGSRRAQRSLGEWYLNRRGHPRDIREAVLWLSRASNSGDRGAKDALQEILGSAARHNRRCNLGLIRTAAEEGVGLAQRLLGKKYLYGRGCPRDLREAAVWLSRASNRGDRAAKELIREKLQGAARHGRSGDLEFVRVFAEKGVAQAQYVVGMSYLVGSSGEKRDYRLARQWLQCAADQDHTHALYRLGMMCLDGVDTRRDRQTAIMWITRAARQGSADADCELVRMYFDHCDTLCDRSLALECLERASLRCGNFQDTRSCTLLEEFAGWLLQVAKADNARAKFIVGRIYFHGIGVAPSRTTALMHFRRAAELGHAEAARLLALNSSGGSTSANPPSSTSTADT